MSHEPNSTSRVSRREFLSRGTAAALVVAIPFEAEGTATQAPDAARAFAPNAFLRITTDNRITVVCASAEMGQGVLTAIPMLVAEELDADWTQVAFEQAPTDAAYNNPMFSMQGTGGSTTVRAFWTPMRRAGATARAMLVAAAADKWGLGPDQLTTRDSHVLSPDGRKLAYGELVAAAARQPVPANPSLKDPKSFRILGHPMRRLDTPAKIDGSARFGLDAEVPGALVAVMARSPLPGVEPTTVDDSAALAVKGVRRVIRIPSGVAVLADGFWAAKQGRDQLRIEWNLGDRAHLSSADITRMLADGARNADAIARKEGDPEQMQKPGARTVESEYEAPFLAHACMEPLNCTASVRSDGADIWAGTQAPGPIRAILAQVTGLPADKITIHPHLLGGGFGRRFGADFPVDAALLSKQAGQPVKLVYTREDDMAAGHYRPASVARFAAVLDETGLPTMLKVGIGCPSITASSGFGKLPDSGVDAPAVEGIADHPYAIAHQKIAYGRREAGPKVWFWRSVGHSQNIFFMESFIDELAVAAGKDPYEYRRALLAHQPRYRGVLELAAQKAGWGTPAAAGIHRGIAVGQSFGSYVAEVAEVSVAPDGTPRVHRVVAAVDCGATVNPQIIRRQIEGAIVFGLSAALYGRITVRDGRIEQGNFHDYPVLRMSAMPAVEVHIVPSTEAPGGIGEPGTPPLAPAVANAIFAATGKRVRRLPIDPKDLRHA